MADKKLTGKQKSFAEYYTDFSNKQTYNNGQESARAANYKGNDDTLKAVACENLTKPYIKAYIADIEAKRREKMEYNQVHSRQLLEKQLTKADKSDDVMAAIAAIRELNTIFALRKDNLNVTSDRQRVLDEIQTAEAHRLAIIANREALRKEVG